MEGKIHKKKLAQQKLAEAGNQDKKHYCELCDVICSSKDGLEAHMRGSKHNKVVTLYKRMGKPVPTATTATSEGSKTVMVTAPRYVTSLSS